MNRKPANCSGRSAPAAATMSADPVHRRLASEEEARRKAGPLRPDEDDGHLPRLESDPR